MLNYNISPEVEAFSTHKDDVLAFEVILPAHQAHSAEVRRVPEELDDISGVDALITNQRGVRIGIKTADCVPVLLFDEGKQAVAAVHSGWKGTVQNIISATIKRMQAEFGTCPSDLKAVIGPCIHEEAFEVGDEVYEKFREMPELKDCGVPGKRLPAMNGECGDNRLVVKKWHINLPEVCRIELMQSGVMEANIEVCPVCTWHHHTYFFSARRLGKSFDRQRIINAIMLKEDY